MEREPTVPAHTFNRCLDHPLLGFVIIPVGDAAELLSGRQEDACSIELATQWGNHAPPHATRRLGLFHQRPTVGAFLANRIYRDGINCEDPA